MWRKRCFKYNLEPHPGPVLHSHLVSHYGCCNDIQYVDLKDLLMCSATLGLNALIVTEVKDQIFSGHDADPARSSQRRFLLFSITVRSFNFSCSSGKIPHHDPDDSH
ncbi:hypothetical protein ATANTOWER_006224 [Ataeniobius toweri]|uniref:Uncharacterized protein n=1 Tax=Ataeniobius toweri TaxID=208326 RepID=A0ABU7BX21_9TELE|nr:hypothetical protein [Ataeniobius toweri]